MLEDQPIPHTVDTRLAVVQLIVAKNLGFPRELRRLGSRSIQRNDFAVWISQLVDDTYDLLEIECPPMDDYCGNIVDDVWNLYLLKIGINDDDLLEEAA